MTSRTRAAHRESEYGIARDCRLIRAAHQRGKTLGQLARLTGISASKLGKFSSMDALPGIAEMRKIADALLMSVSDIWPGIRELRNWGYLHQLITERIGKVDYHGAEFAELCQERAAISVRIYISESRSRPQCLTA